MLSGFKTTLSKQINLSKKVQTINHSTLFYLSKDFFEAILTLIQNAILIKT